MDELMTKDTPHGTAGFTHVYLARLPERGEVTSLGYPPRDGEIEGIRNGKVRREKYFVFRLLERAARESLGLSIKELAPERSECGRWYSPMCDFSLAHSGGMLAVAISSERVGIDLQRLLTPASPGFAERTLTAGEFIRYKSLVGEERGRYLISAWSGKEAIFKTLGEESFVPSKLDTEHPSSTVCDELKDHRLLTDCLERYGEKFVLSVFFAAEYETVILKDIEL